MGVTELLADEIVTSAKLATAIIDLLGTVADEAITSAKLASGAVGGDRIWDGAIVSAHIGANVIATPHILNQGILSASIGAAEIGTPHIKDANITSAKIGVGEIGDVLLAAYGVVSGKYASGSIMEPALASGISIDIAEMAMEPTFKAGNIISAYMAIQFTPAISGGGHFDLAQAGNVSSVPAVGVAVANIASGSVGVFQHKGRITNADWDFSGYAGQMVFVGTSSEVTLTAPSLSGECIQRLGKVAGPTTIFLNPDMSFVQLAE